MIRKFLHSIFLNCIFLQFRYRVPFEFILKAKREARRTNIKISCSDISEMYFDIENKSKLFGSHIKANKATVNLSLQDAKRIYAERKGTGSNFEALIDYLIKTKKHDVKFSVDELIELYRNNRNLAKITDGLIKAKAEGVNLSGSEIKTLFYRKKEYEKILEYYITAKKEGLNLELTNIRVLFLKNIDIIKAINVSRTLKRENLRIPFKVLSELLEDKINVTKCIKILQKAKKSCIEDLLNENLFDEQVCENLANTYVILGKEKFKKEVSELIVNLNRLDDPAELYHKLVTKESYGFKITLEIIKEYLNFDFTADIDEITKAYLKARTNGLYITFEQLAKLAEVKVNVQEFVDAKIKSIRTEEFA